MEIEEPKNVVQFLIQNLIQIKFKQSKFIKLIWIWEPPRKRKKLNQNQKKKYDQMRVHKVDAKKLEKLINFFLPIWAQKAGKIFENKN